MIKFKIGDVVIKKTGGDKMIIVDQINEYDYKCFWCDDTLIHEQIFNKDEIITLNDYKNILKIEEREDKINKIFKKK